MLHDSAAATESENEFARQQASSESILTFVMDWGRFHFLWIITALLWIFLTNFGFNPTSTVSVTMVQPVILSQPVLNTFLMYIGSKKCMHSADYSSVMSMCMTFTPMYLLLSSGSAPSLHVCVLLLGVVGSTRSGMDVTIAFRAGMMVVSVGVAIGCALIVDTSIMSSPGGFRMLETDDDTVWSSALSVVGAIVMVVGISTWKNTCNPLLCASISNAMSYALVLLVSLMMSLASDADNGSINNLTAPEFMSLVTFGGGIMIHQACVIVFFCVSNVWFVLVVMCATYLVLPVTQGLANGDFAALDQDDDAANYNGSITNIQIAGCVTLVVSVIYFGLLYANAKGGPLRRIMGRPIYQCGKCRAGANPSNEFDDDIHPGPLLETPEASLTTEHDQDEFH